MTVYDFLGVVMDMSALLNNLNEHQREAVGAPLVNCLVLAGAGSGKTRVLVNRIAWLLQVEQMSPYSIMAVTFTNKAAGEMKSRLSQLLGYDAQGLWVGTFHSLAHRLLRKHWQAAGLVENFQILDSDDQLRMVKRVMKALGVDDDKWPPKQIQWYINGKKDEGLRPEHIQAFDPATKTMVKIYEHYEQACQRAGVIDFAEILLRAHELFLKNNELLAHYQQRFNAILVDEFQDTNTIQYAWIKLLAGGNATVMAVGDDDQSIYGWRGARIENIEKFTRDYPQTKVIRLEQNYRSTANILNAANHLIANNAKRMGKNLWTQDDAGQKITVYAAFNEIDEARFVVERIGISLNQGTQAKDIAILYRSNAQSRVLEEMLIKTGINYRIIGGVRFFERAEIKDVLSYLRLVVNHSDDNAFERIVNFPTRGIGEKTLSEVRSIARANQTSLWQACCDVLNGSGLSARAKTSLTKFMELIELLNESILSMELHEKIEHIIKHSGLFNHYNKTKGEKNQARLDNMQELVNAAKQFHYEETEEDDELQAFLTHAALESGETQAADGDDYVHLMTMHSAKGLEFPHVYLVGLEEGLFPSRQSYEQEERLEEERRLCYVGMTRAMEQLTLSYAEIRRQYGREEYHKPSRFLRELPPELLDEVRIKASYQSVSAGVSQASSPSYAANEVKFGFLLGQAVMHPKFGQGTVMNFEGSGAHARVQVNFGTAGVKWLVVAYANLQPLEKC